MNFSPIMISTLVIEPLRYFFSTYGGNSKLVWDVDEKKRTMDIGHMYDFYKVPLEERPRIVVDRGGFRTNKVGLTDNLAEQKSLIETSGLKDRINMQMYSGTANLIVEARQMGTCELLADMTLHFLAWARPTICSTQGFKEFGGEVSISPCALTEKENTEKFQIQMQFPWIREEHWRNKDDGIKLKNILLNLPNQS
jgi:hypothetical protein